MVDVVTDTNAGTCFCTILSVSISVSDFVYCIFVTQNPCQTE